MNALRRLLVVLVLAAATVLVAFTRPAWACSCAQINPLESAELAFTGVAVSVDRPWRSGDVEVRFAIETVQKGAAAEHVDLVTHSDSATCGYDFTEGHRYRVYVTDGRTTLCDGNEDLGLAETTTPTGTPTPTGPPIALWTAVTAGLVLTAAAILLLRRRRTRS